MDQSDSPIGGKDLREKLTQDDDLWQRLADASVAYECDCHFKTTSVEYLRAHYYNGDCIPSGKDVSKMRNRMRVIVQNLRAVYDAKTLLEAEHAHLASIAALEDRPLPAVVKPRLCRLCHKPTREWSPDGSPECNRHVTRDDGVRNTLGQTKSDILATLLSSKK